jgi:arylsulfatase A-like enzyme
MSRPNIFLLTVDTLRADHLSCYGEDTRVATPNLDNLASDGELYLTAMSCANQTVPSYTGLLTGQYPSSLRMKVTSRLDEPTPTLPLFLKREGYRTYCWTVASAVGRENGVAKDFEHYELIPSNKFMSSPMAPTSLRIRSRLKVLNGLLWRAETLHKYLLAMNDGLGPSGGPRILRRLKQVCDGAREPIFVLANFFDPHSPYHPPKRHWRKRLTAWEYLAAMKVNLGHWNNVRRSKALTERNRHALRRLYESEVAYVDELIGDFVDYLKSAKAYDDALIIVTADHGESLGEHDLLGHWHALYEDLVHVPLIIKWPGSAREGRISRLVQNVDILPTLLAHLDIEEPPHIEGLSLLGDIPDDRLGIAEQLDNPADIYIRRPEFAQWQQAMSDFNYTAVALRQGKYKYIAYSNGRRQLFDLELDPAEMENKAESNRAQAARFEEILVETGRDAIIQASEDEDEQEILVSHLQALGYL